MDAAALREIGPDAPEAADLPPDRTIADQPAVVGARFQPLPPRTVTPTGTLSPAIDLNSQQGVLLLLVDLRATPTPVVADRALRELKQLAKVKSERVLRIVDQGKTPDGRLYIATEMPGEPTLEEVVRKDGRLAPDRARALLLDVGEALLEAQKVGVIHRDLAPRNIVVGARARVTGFGVAEPVDERVFGAPAFLSPEQAEGKPVDQRSNIYSLGALFYYMLTGEPPFPGDPQSQVQQHLHAVPAPPSQKRAVLPAEVDKIVLKALEKAGGRRHLTLRQLLNEVEALVLPAADGAAADSAPSGVSTGPGEGLASPAHADEARAPTLAADAPAAPAEAATAAATAANSGPAGNSGTPGTPGTPGMEASPSKATPSDDLGSARTILGMEAPMRRVAMPAQAEAPDDEPAGRGRRTDLEATDPTLQPVTMAQAAASAAPGVAAPIMTSDAGAATIINVQAPPEVLAAAAEMARVAAAEDASGRRPAPAPAPPPVVKTQLVEQPAPPPERMPVQIAPVPMAAGGPPGAPVALAATPQRANAQAGTGPGGRRQKGFRETGWFKRGEIEEEMARANAELSARDPLAGGAQTEAVVDESTLTAEDGARLSLKTGRTEMMQAVRPQNLPGERMSEHDVIAELDAGPRRVLVVGGAAIGLVALLVAIYFLFLHH